MSGQVIGNWELGEELGSGEMGVVYRARHIQDGREGAVKILSLTETIAKHLSYEEASERFRREIDTLQRLRTHPNVVDIYDSGEDQDVLFMVLELLDGRSLEQLLETPLSAEDTCHIGLQIASALAHTHGRGVFHRDVKPSNLFCCRDGRVVLLDFGIALDPEKSRLTTAGNVAGSMTYTSPQRLRCEDTDPAKDDVFSLGVTMAELLCGRGAFSRNIFKADRFDVLGTLGLPDWLHALLLELVADEPGARPDASQTTQRLQEGIARFGDAPEPVSPDAPEADGEVREDDVHSFMEPVEVLVSCSADIAPEADTAAPEEAAPEAQPASLLDPVAQEGAALPEAQPISPPQSAPPPGESAATEEPDRAAAAEETPERRRMGWLWLGGAAVAVAALALFVVVLVTLLSRSEPEVQGLATSAEVQQAPEVPEAPEPPPPDEADEEEAAVDIEPPSPADEPPTPAGDPPPSPDPSAQPPTPTPVASDRDPVTDSTPPPGGCPPGDSDCLLSSSDEIAASSDADLMAALEANEKQEEVMVTDPDNRERLVGLLPNISSCNDLRLALSQTHNESIAVVTATKQVWCPRCLSETPLRPSSGNKCKDGYKLRPEGCVHPNLQYCDSQYLKGGQ